MRARGPAAILEPMALLLDTTSPLTIRCATVEDIAAALAYARQEGLALGGEGVLLDLSALQAIHIDAVRRIAWVQPGVQQADLEAVAAEHGLTPDGLRVARVVTADGVRTASEEECVELLRDDENPAVVAEYELALRPAAV
jgi:FAD/FMN-containing dehydrogenase